MCLEGQDAFEEERIYLSEKNVSHAHGFLGRTLRQSTFY